MEKRKNSKRHTVYKRRCHRCYSSRNDKGNRLTANQIALGSKLAVVATGVDSFTEKDGKVFPGCTIILTDKTGKEILNLPDAFAEMKEGCHCR